MAEFKIGVAEVDFTPPPGLPLMGNFRDDYASRGMHDPLFAHALVIENAAGVRLGILTLDICMVTRDNTVLIRQVIGETAQVKPENVLIAATHTHSGPAPSRELSLPACSPAAVAQFLTVAAGAVAAAEKQMQPSSLTFSRTQESHISFNRRLACKDGKTHMNWEGLDPDFVIKPLGPIDPEVAVLGIQAKGKTRSALVNFALHPAVLAGDNWLYSADYPGYLSEAMKRLLGQEFITLFANGCCGNVNHIDYTDKLQGRGYQMTQRIGHMLAVAVGEALRSKVPVRGSSLAVSREMVALPRYQITEEKRQWAEAVMERVKKQPSKGQVDGLPDDFYAMAYLKMHAIQLQDDHVEVMAIRLGDIAIVGVPGENFCELGLRLKKESPAKHTLVIELANDAIGYLPTREAFAQGGYEPSAGSTMYQPGAGDRIVDCALAQLQQLFKA